MSKRPNHSLARGFLRGLLITSLSLLLPCQLGLLWLATLEGPVLLPDFAASFLTDRLAKEGLRVQARNFRFRSDRTLIAEDITVEVAGLTGELFTAESLEVGIDVAALLHGELAPTRLRLRDGQLWCPASVSRSGTRRLMAERIDCDFAKEGRWLIVPGLRGRSGRLSLHLLGELPAGLLHPETKPDEQTAPLARRLAFGLAKLEHGLLLAENFGGAAIDLQARSRSDGGSSVEFEMLVGNDWLEKEFGAIKAKDLQLRGRLSLDARGAPGTWRMTAQAADISLGKLNAERVRLSLTSRNTWLEARGEIGIENLTYDGIGGARVRATIEPRELEKGAMTLDFSAFTAGSIAEGQVTLRHDMRPTRILIRNAALSAEEMKTVPVLKENLRTAKLELDGSVLLHGCELTFGDESSLLSSRGRASASGFRGLGISAEAISPRSDRPLLVNYDFDSRRRPYALRLRDICLATVTGQADCSLNPAGPFLLQLHGAIAPAALDGLLGDWWIGLWQMLRPQTRPPHAVIGVAGKWGEANSMVVDGRVQLENFEFMRAPFRSVEVSVAADRHRTLIGLHRLDGGSRPDDGSVDGSVQWDWDKPGVESGPVVKVEGDLQPWVAARCVSKELSDALRGLSLPWERKFSLRITPDLRQPRIIAELRCPEGFSAWGIPAHDLTLKSTTTNGILALNSGFGLAGGRAELSVTGDLLRETGFTLRLSEANPGELGRIIARFTTPQEDPAGPLAAKNATSAKMSLEFKGSLKPGGVTQLRGLGSYKLDDPDLKKIRVLGGISGLLEALGVDATTYDLTHAEGTFGCLDGQAYFPDMLIGGPQSRLDLAGQINLLKSSLEFEGDFSLRPKEGIGILNLLNLNRTLVGLTKIRVKGPISNPEVSTTKGLSDIIKPKTDNDLGKIPAALME